VVLSQSKVMYSVADYAVHLLDDDEVNAAATHAQFHNYLFDVIRHQASHGDDGAQL
jgi:hypothetical protein